MCRREETIDKKCVERIHRKNNRLGWKLTQLALLKQKETEFLLIPQLGGLTVKEATTGE